MIYKCIHKFLEDEDSAETPPSSKVGESWKRLFPFDKDKVYISNIG